MTAVTPAGSALQVDTPQELAAVRALHPLTGIVPWVGDPAAVEQDLVDEITDAITHHPRSLQRTLGPSEVGTVCTRRLLHKLNQDPEPAGTMPWLATIGTAMHAWLAEVMAGAIGQELTPPRYLIEHRVMVGHIAGQEIWGNSDLFDHLSGTVGDWKLVGKAVLDGARRKGPNPQYRTQAHLYGRGYALQGYRVNHVMLMYLPRNELSLSARCFWAEPYDESVALAALSRANALAALLAAVGIDAAAAMYGPCSDIRYCPWCKRTPAPATTSGELFAGATKG